MTRKMVGGGQSHIYVFYHIFCNENTLDILRDQATKILYSGLYADAMHIYCFLVGKKGDIDTVKAYIETLPQKFVVKAEGVDDKTFEQFTMTKIDGLVHANDKILYIHTKGVVRSGGKTTASDCIYLWRNYMEWYVIANYKKCLEKLKDHDVVGAIYKDSQIGPHFSGNFWWSTGSYFKKLTAKTGNKMDSESPMAYWAAESYLFTAAPKHLSLDGGVLGNSTCMYSTPMYMKLYADKPIL